MKLNDLKNIYTNIYNSIEKSVDEKSPKERLICATYDVIAFNEKNSFEKDYEMICTMNELDGANPETREEVKMWYFDSVCTRWKVEKGILIESIKRIVENLTTT